MLSFTSRSRATPSSTAFSRNRRRVDLPSALTCQVVVIGAVLALVLLVGIAVILGPYRIAPANLIAFLIAKLSGAASPLPASAEAVILQIRLPRIFAAMAIGAALAASGAAYQSLFRNPLVSPDILGVSSGAALGAVIGIFLSLPILAIEATSFCGGLLAVLPSMGLPWQSRGAMQCWCWSSPALSSVRCSALVSGS